MMDDDIDCICVEDANTLADMQTLLKEFPSYGGFPLVHTVVPVVSGGASSEKEGSVDIEEWVLLGYIHAKELSNLGTGTGR